MKISRALNSHRVDSLPLARSTSEAHGPAMLPWADPYIADLQRENVRELRRAERDIVGAGFNCRIRQAYPAPRAVVGSQPQEKMIRSRTLGAREW